MAAPPVVIRIAPDGIRLDNGWQTLFIFQNAPGLDIWEKTVQRPAAEGGDPIETDTMLNALYLTKSPQCLVGFDEGVVVAAYDPAAMSDIDDQINVSQSLTHGYPDGSAYAYWGYLRRAEYSPMEKGVQPEVTLTIVETDWDPINCVEAGPVYVDGTGSCHC